jgi:hypothetical protein
MDLQLWQWMLCAVGTAGAALLFMAIGTNGRQRMARAATRLGVILALATVFCVAEGVAKFLQTGGGPLIH